MSAHCNKCGYDLSLDLDCAHCAAVARAEKAEAERDTAQEQAEKWESRYRWMRNRRERAAEREKAAQASEARLREALTRADALEVATQGLDHRPAPIQEAAYEYREARADTPGSPYRRLLRTCANCDRPAVRTVKGFPLCARCEPAPALSTSPDTEPEVMAEQHFAAGTETWPEYVETARVDSPDTETRCDHPDPLLCDHCNPPPDTETRGVREWTLYVCDGCGWASSTPDDDPTCDCSCAEHEEPPPIRRVTVREVPAPTDQAEEGGEDG